MNVAIDIMPPALLQWLEQLPLPRPGVIALLAALVLLAGCGHFNSYACTEWWYEQGHPERLGERVWTDRFNHCRKKPPDSYARRYEIIDGTPYLVETELDSRDKRGLLGGQPTGGVERHLHIRYYRINTEVNTARLHTWRQRGSDVQGYASDGVRVFYMTTVIPGADPETFEVLDEHFDGLLWAPWHHSWARDGRRAYHQGREVPGARPDDLRFVTENLLVSAGKVFESERSGRLERWQALAERPDMDASLRRINAGYTADIHHVYFRGERVESADPETFRPVASICPVPGQPRLGCASRTVTPEQLLRGASEVGESRGRRRFLGRDRNNVYMGEQVLRLQGDAGTFNPLEDGELHVFWLCAGNSECSSPDGLYAVTSGRLIWLNHLYGVEGVEWVPYRGTLFQIDDDQPHGYRQLLRDDDGRIEIQHGYGPRFRRLAP